MGVLERYSKAMRSIDGASLCYRIEQEYGLDGYPPELVSVGLRAIDDGCDPHEAIQAYIGDPNP
jgi:hypothetical protein